MLLLLVTADGGSQMIEWPEALAVLRMPLRWRPETGLETREYVLVDELRSPAMREPLFVYEERRPGARAYPRAEQEIPMCRDIRRAADPNYGRSEMDTYLRTGVLPTPPPASAQVTRVVVRDGLGGQRELPAFPLDVGDAPTAGPVETATAALVSHLELTMFLRDLNATNHQDRALALLRTYDIRKRE